MKRTRPRMAPAMAALSRSALCFAGIVALTAACGAQQGRNGGNAGGKSPRHGKVTACARRDIKVAVDVHAAGVGAGTAFIPLDFTNISRASCRLARFPVVSLATSHSGRQIGVAAALDRSRHAARLVLPTGRTAHVWIRFADVASLPAATCKPVFAGGIRVRLARKRRPMFINYPLTTCAKRLRGTVLMTVGPFHLGRARAGGAH